MGFFSAIESGLSKVGSTIHGIVEKIPVVSGVVKFVEGNPLAQEALLVGGTLGGAAGSNALMSALKLAPSGAVSVAGKGLSYAVSSPIKALGLGFSSIAVGSALVSSPSLQSGATKLPNQFAKAAVNTGQSIANVAEGNSPFTAGTGGAIGEIIGAPLGAGIIGALLGAGAYGAYDYFSNKTTFKDKSGNVLLEAEGDRVSEFANAVNAQASANSVPIVPAPTQTTQTETLTPQNSNIPLGQPLSRGASSTRKRRARKREPVQVRQSVRINMIQSQSKSIKRTIPILNYGGFARNGY